MGGTISKLIIASNGLDDLMTEEENLSLKICLLGDNAVGKTSLIRKYAYDIFDDSYIPTMGMKVIKDISIEIKEYNKKYNVTFWIYDTMGDAQYRGLLNGSHLSGLSGAFLVCDVTRPETLENLIFWADSIYKECDENIPIIYMANKSDLTGGQMFDLADMERLTEVFKAPWLLTSARTGDNVEEAFRILGMKMIKNHLHNTGFNLPRNEKGHSSTLIEK